MEPTCQGKIQYFDQGCVEWAERASYRFIAGSISAMTNDEQT
jgi:hypothetical protein